MPKLVKRDTGIASLKELMEDPFSSIEFLDRDKKGNPVTLIDNSQEDILEAVKELINPNPAKNHSVLEIEINHIWNKYIPWNLSIPKAFLTKYGAALLNRG